MNTLRPALNRGGRTWSLGLGANRWQAQRRTIIACTLLAAAALVIGFAALCHGTGWESPRAVWSAIIGERPGGMVITEWRMPRVAAGLVFGAALGVAGCIFQNVSRNALGSPDIIGLDAGAYTGALVAITVLGSTAFGLGALSIVGGLLTAAAIYLLSLQSGFSGIRLVVIGIAMNAMLTAINSWIILRADLDVAIVSAAWSAGSLNGLDWAEVIWPTVVISAMFVILAFHSGSMHQAALGDDVATTSGVDLRRLRVVLIVVGVGCSATVTAVAGPIVFVALAAPQIGRRLAGSAGVALMPAALTGALILVASDLLAQVVLRPIPLPVGVVTTAVGGIYLLWLLSKEVKR